MTQKEIEKYIYTRIGQFCEPLGFTYLPLRNQFRKTTDIGFQCVIISISPYPDAILLELHLGLRNNLIEDLAFQFTNGFSEFQKDSLTLVASFGKIQGKKYLRHEIKNKVDADSALKETLHFLEKKGFAWLKRHQDLKVIDHILNEEPTEKTLFMPNQVHRCLRGLVAAKMVNREGFSFLVKAYQTRLNSLYAPSHQQEAFDRLSLFLDDYSAN